MSTFKKEPVEAVALLLEAGADVNAAVEEVNKKGKQMKGIDSVWCVCVCGNGGGGKGNTA